jgi:hypothetical protein
MPAKDLALHQLAPSTNMAKVAARLAILAMLLRPKETDLSATDFERGLLPASPFRYSRWKGVSL